VSQKFLYHVSQGGSQVVALSERPPENPEKEKYRHIALTMEQPKPAAPTSPAGPAPLPTQLDPVTGHFRRVPQEEKTSEMLTVEKRLGKSLEEDFIEYYHNAHYSQAKMATRWGVTKATIFSNKLRGGSTPCWVVRLNLQHLVRAADMAQETPPQFPSLPQQHDKAAAAPKENERCEVCGTNDVGLERAHWQPEKQGGTMDYWNILRLCPNCHTKLDNQRNHETTEKARRVLLLRVAKRILGQQAPDDDHAGELVARAAHILHWRQNPP
jgi:DNA-binding XRE family transcriptional regulator